MITAFNDPTLPQNILYYAGVRYRNKDRRYPQLVVTEDRAKAKPLNGPAFPTTWWFRNQELVNSGDFVVI